MPKYIKTYGIYGLLEWHGVLKAGAVSMRVAFTNGSTTAYGVAPATLITKDELTQFVVEHCEKFKNGTIVKVSEKVIPGSETVIRVTRPVNLGNTNKANTAKAPTTTEGANTAKAPVVAEEGKTAKAPTTTEEANTAKAPVVTEEGKTAKAPAAAETSENISAEGQADNNETSAGVQETIDENGIKVVTVSTKSDAVDYLKDNFKDKKYTATKLRNKDAFEAACKECGVRFVW